MPAIFVVRQGNTDTQFECNLSSSQSHSQKLAHEKNEWEISLCVQSGWHTSSIVHLLKAHTRTQVEINQVAGTIHSHHA